MSKRRNKLRISPVADTHVIEKYSSSVYSCQPNLIDKTNDLIDKVPDIDERIELRQQLESKALKSSVNEEPEYDPIAHEIMQEFAAYSATDFNDAKSYSEAAHHFGLKFEDKIPTISRADKAQYVFADKKYDESINKILQGESWAKLSQDLTDIEKFKEKWGNKPKADLKTRYAERAPRRFYSHHEYVLTDWRRREEKMHQIFFDDKLAKEYLIKKRWGDKVCCPYCGFSGKIYVIEGGNRFKCGDQNCFKKFSAKVGTMFEDTKMPLFKWFSLMFLLSSNKYKTISIMKLSELINVTYSTGWKAVHKFRKNFKSDLLKDISEPLLTGEYQDEMRPIMVENVTTKIKAILHATEQN